MARASTVALLVAVAGALVWSGPGTCGPGFLATGSGPAVEPGASAAAGSGTGSAAEASGQLPPRASPTTDLPVPEPGSVDARPLDPPAGARPAVPAGRVGVPVRLTEPAALAMIRPGDLVDVLRVDGAGRSARVAGAAPVLGVTDAGDSVTAGLLVALTPAEAERVISHTGGGFAVLLRPG